MAELGCESIHFNFQSLLLTTMTWILTIIAIKSKQSLMWYFLNNHEKINYPSLGTFNFFNIHEHNTSSIWIKRPKTIEITMCPGVTFLQGSPAPEPPSTFPPTPFSSGCFHLPFLPVNSCFESQPHHPYLWRRDRSLDWILILCFLRLSVVLFLHYITPHMALKVVFSPLSHSRLGYW